MTWQHTHPRVLQSLAPEYHHLAAEQVDTLLRGNLGLGLGAAEGFFGDLGKAVGGIGRTVGKAVTAAAPVVAKAAPGAISGALSGAPLGPAGIIAGATAGGLSGALAPTPRRVVSGVVPSGQMPGGLRGPAGAAPGAAVAQLLAALASPTVQHALTSMMLGSAGARSVPAAGGGPVPLAAITNLLGSLAVRASAQWQEVAPPPDGDLVAGPSAGPVASPVVGLYAGPVASPTASPDPVAAPVALRTPREPDLANPQARADVLLDRLLAVPGWAPSVAETTAEPDDAAPDGSAGEGPAWADESTGWADDADVLWAISALYLSDDLDDDPTDLDSTYLDDDPTDLDDAGLDGFNDLAEEDEEPVLDSGGWLP
ncbi:MAG: hypothetical protein ACRC35_13250 [Angustibacter sp.]